MANYDFWVHWAGSGEWWAEDEPYDLGDDDFPDEDEDEDGPETFDPDEPSGLWIV